MTGKDAAIPRLRTPDASRCTSECQPSADASGGASDSGLGATDGAHDSESDAGSAGLLASPYPRLGSYPIGDPHDYYDSTFIAWAAKQQVVIMNIWDGWEADTGSHKMAEIIEQIHAASTLSIPTIALQYRHINGTQDASVNSGQLTTSVTLADRDGLILLDP